MELLNCRTHLEMHVLTISFLWLPAALEKQLMRLPWQWGPCLIDVVLSTELGTLWCGERASSPGNPFMAPLYLHPNVRASISPQLSHHQVTSYALGDVCLLKEWRTRDSEGFAIHHIVYSSAMSIRVDHGRAFFGKGALRGVVW